MYFTGTARAVAQVSTATPANVEIGDIFSFLVNGILVATYTAAAATVADVCTGLEAAWAVARDTNGDPYAFGITSSDDTTHITLTGIAGLPFVVTATAVNGGAADTQTLTMATPTAATGPHHWDDVDNWDTGAIPANADDVVIANSDVNICWGTDQNAVTLGSLDVRKSYTGRIGLNWSELAHTADGETTVSTAVNEYRNGGVTYLKIGSDVVVIGEDDSPGTAAGSDRIKIDNVKAGASVTEIHSMATAASESLPACRLLFAHANADVYIRSAAAGVGIAIDQGGETSTVGTVSVSDSTTATRVVIGDGVTITTWEQRGGVNLLQAAATITTVTYLGGTLTINGAFLITTLNVGLLDSTYATPTLVPQGATGTVYVNNVPAAGSAVTTANLNYATTDTTRCAQARTWDVVNKRTAATFRYDENVVTVTDLNVGLP
jgi:hypothetical protein